MMPAAKHGDPQLGVDIHLCVVPPSPSPVPLPTPHMSMVFDPMDYLPFIGATVTVCGMKRAVAGTSGTVVHIPPGFPFAPKLPDKNDEIFMGSATVVADGDPFSFLGVPVLACQVVGMPSPPRPRRKGGPRAMLLPTVFNLAIPSTVFVGGPPTISLMGMAFKLGFAGLGRLAKTRFAKALGTRFRNWRKAKFGHLKSSFLKCTILRAEPVNIVTGAVSVEQEDFALTGPILLRWTRSYASDNPRRGACGTGWETPADARLEHDRESGVVLFHDPEGNIAIFPAAPHDVGAAASVLELMDGARLSDEGEEFRIRTKEDCVYRFRKSHVAATSDGNLEYPLGVIEDLYGNTLSYERDTQRRLIAICERAGRRIEVEYGTAGLIRRVSLHVPESGFRHVFVEYEQDERDDLSEVRDTLGHPLRFVYDEHHMVRHADRNGLSFHYQYDKAPSGWRVVRSWGDGGLHDYRFDHLDAANERRITDSLGGLSIVTLDERGLPVSEVDPLGGLTTFEYDEAGRTTAVTDRGGLRTEYQYDERGNLLSVKLPDGATTSHAYDEGSHLVRTTDPLGRNWDFTWSAQGALLEHKDPAGGKATFRYGATGCPLEFADAEGRTARYGYDASGNQTEMIDASGAITRFDYNELGEVTREIDPLGRITRHFYDNKGRHIRTSLPSGVNTEFAYDAEDNVIRETDEDGGITTVEYCGTGEVKRQRLADGHSIEYHYDTEERLIAITNQKGESYRLGRDALGRVVEETDYWGHAWRRELTPAGHVRRTVDPLGRVSEYTTDALGRVLKSSSPDSFHPDRLLSETFEFDLCGNLVACENDNIRIERELDALDRVVEERQGNLAVVKNVYDQEGRRIRRQVSISSDQGPIEHDVSFAYDADGRWEKVVVDGRTTTHADRDAAGQISAEALLGGLRREYRYDRDGNLAAQRMLAASGPLFVQQYKRDGRANITGRRDSEFGDDRYAYDAVGRPTGHWNPSGAAHTVWNDPVGDRLSTRVSDENGLQGRWSRTGSYQDIGYRFDAAGNLTERSDPHRTSTFVWDANQRLVQSHTGDETITYLYDPLGRRIAKLSSAREVRFVWDEDALAGDVVCRPNGSHVQWREWINVPDSFAPLAMRQGGIPLEKPTLHLYHNEPNGAPVRLFDEEGKAVWMAAYDCWGTAHPLRGENGMNPLRLQGQYDDAETGLHYNRHRYYDPNIGQFISYDPLGLAAGTNLSAFGPNVWSWIDPLGLKCLRNWTRKNTAAGKLPRFSGRTRNYVRRQLQAHGFSRDRSVLNSEHWWHPDGSKIRMDPPHKEWRGPANGGFRGDVEHHVHKEWTGPGGLQKLDDYGRASADMNRTHIIIKKSAHG
ncbi:RHS repeat-associated core domain-containing protein [Rhodospirillales bacterium URHD0017]|nr:RHS repeat-associated core domain-containing protein [Rhodospirillales bacterium URHD0017]